MLESLPVTLIVGTVLGFLAGLGIGGGSLLVLWLTAVLGVSQADARSINLLFFIPSAVIAAFFRWKQGRLQLQNILPAMLGGCVCAALFSWLSSQLQLELLRKLFGFLLVATGLREIFYRPRKAR